MMTEVPELFDPVKVGMAALRAIRMGAETFLLDRMREDLADRLGPIMRRYSAVCDIGTPLHAFADVVTTSGKLAEGSAISACDESAPPPIDSCDLITSGMVFHRVNDLPGLMIQLRRALKPDGLLLAVFPGGDTLHELRDVLLRAESEITGAAALRVLPMVDVRAAGQLLQRAGLALPVVDSEKITVRYASVFTLFKDLRAMGATATMLRRMATPPLTRAVLLRAAELYSADYADRDGKIRATFEFIWMSGWAPHDGQQKPLKPGSAKARLADALATPVNFATSGNKSEP